MMGTRPGWKGLVVRGRWFGICGLFIVVTLATSSNAYGGVVTAASEPGSHVTTVKKAGFSIAVPEAWAVIDLTKKQAASLLKGVRKKFPQLANELPDDLKALGQNIKLLAVDTATGDLRGNMNAALDRASTALPPKSEIQEGYKKAGLEPDAEIVDAKIGGRSGYEVNMPTTAQRQLWVIGDRGLLIFSFSSSTTDDPRDDPVVAAMMNSVQLQ
jgi:hypothetical protein